MNTVTAMTTAADFFCRLLVGRNVLTKRREIEVEVRYSYCGHSQGALISALNKAFEPSTSRRWCWATPPLPCLTPRGATPPARRPAEQHSPSPKSPHPGEDGASHRNVVSPRKP